MRPDATLRKELLVPKEGVAHYWQSDQKLPTMGSKTVDRGGKKTAETGTKTAETGTKNCETETKNWRQMRGGGRPKSASTEEVRSAGMGLLIETPLCVAPMCVPFLHPFVICLKSYRERTDNKFQIKVFAQSVLIEAPLWVAPVPL